MTPQKHLVATTKTLFTLILALIPSLAAAAIIEGTVISISDGDTLTIVDDQKIQHKVRLSAIDAPEKTQPFGQKAKQALSDLCYKKYASVVVIDTDRYGRSVGEVECNGRHANEIMLSRGMAWVYRKYAEGYAHFYRIEEVAKAKRVGLWEETNPIAPWEWRKASR